MFHLLPFVIIVYYYVFTPHVVMAHASADEICTYNISRSRDRGVANFLDGSKYEFAICTLSPLYIQQQQQQHLGYYYYYYYYKPPTFQHDLCKMSHYKAERDTTTIVTISGAAAAKTAEDSRSSSPTAAAAGPTVQLARSRDGSGNGDGDDDDDDIHFQAHLNALRRRNAARRRRRQRQRSRSISHSDSNRNLKSSPRAGTGAARPVVRMPCLWGRGCRRVKKIRTRMARGSKGLKGRGRCRVGRSTR